MNNLFSWLAFLCMAACQYQVCWVTHLALVSKFQLDDMLLAGAGFCLGVLFGAVAIDTLTSRMSPQAIPKADSPEKPDYRLIVLLLLPAYALGVRLFQFDDWSGPAARFASQLGGGFLFAAANWVFFTLVPRRLAPAAYCAALGAGFALAECQRWLLFAGLPEGAVGSMAASYLRLVIFATLLLTLVLAPGMVVARRHAIPIATAGDAKDGAAGKWKMAGSILLLYILFCLLHGLLSSSFMPLFIASRALDNTNLIAALTVVAFGIGAWRFSRGGTRGFRLVVVVCCVVHLTVPAFSLFKTNTPIVKGLHAVVGPLNYLFTATVIAALAMTAPRRWRVLAMALPLAVKAAAALYLPVLLRDFRENEAMPLAALLTAIAFFVYGQKIAADALAAEPVLAGTPSGTLDMDDAVAMAARIDPETRRRNAITELGARYGFSAREREVAFMLASRLPAEAIGERLGLSTNTVNTYVRRVVIKTDQGGRKNFIKMVEGMVDAEA